MSDFSHLDQEGNVRMVDVSEKKGSNRVALAAGFITLQPETIKKIESGQVPKGNVLTTAKIAGIQAAKRVPELIPLCHQINLSWLDIEFEIQKNGIKINATARAQYTTGVEMEALTAVGVAALTIYDMCKAIDKNMVIDQIRMIKKTGGKSR
jgi:cyclic pyranopterin phosphate synthase